MSPAQINAEVIRDRLLARRAELALRAQHVDRDLGRSNDPLVADFADQAIQRQNDEVLTSIGNSAGQEIAAIDAAIERIEAGRYGTCASCGAQIESARLQSVPYAVTCVRCSRR